MGNNTFMCSKKTAKILGLFYIFLLYSSNSAIEEEEENEFKEELPEKDNFNEENKTGNAFVKFFKYGKHSILWRGINVCSVGHIIEYLSVGEDFDFPCFIWKLIATRYNFKSPIKNNIGYFVSLVFGGDSSFFDFISFLPSLNFLSLNLGIYYTILQKKNFSWDLHAGIGFSWRWSLFCAETSYDAVYRNWINEKTKNYKNNQKYIVKKPEKKELDENESYLKHYFKPKNFLDNIKHFDILLDLSIFDFTIKNHFKISLSWHCGIAYMFYFFKRNEIREKVFNLVKGVFDIVDVLEYLGLYQLTISIGYVF